jgi:type VI secretion system protein ImpH
MAASQWRTHGSLEDYLFSSPHRFDFFQAMVLLKAISVEKSIYKSEWKQFPVGYDYNQHHEVVRFKVSPELKFPKHAIAALSHPTLDQQKNRLNPAVMNINFMGLTGPSGILPLHYSEEILTQNRKKNFALRDFFDMFNHRAVSFYYRGWEKYHVQYSFGSRGKNGEHNDPLTLILKSFAGWSPKTKLKTVALDNLLYYSGFIANERKSAINLEQMLSDYFKIPVNVKPFIGGWNRIPLSQCTRFPTRRQAGQFYELGKNTTLGARVWHSQGKFRVILGPLTQEELKQFLPGKKALSALKSVIRSYVGEALQFDIQLISIKHNIPPCILNKKSPPQLGYFTWMGVTGQAIESDKLILS